MNELRWYLPMKASLLDSVLTRPRHAGAARTAIGLLTSKPAECDTAENAHFIRTDRKRILATNLGVFFDQALVSVASFAASIVVGRTCGKEELGAFSLAVSTFWLLAGISNALVWTPYVTKAPRLRPRRRRLLLGSVTSHLVLVSASLAAILLLCAWIPWPGLADKEWFTSLCLAFVPYTVMMHLREHFRRVHLAHIDSRQLLLLDLPVVLLQLGLLLGLAKAQYLSASMALLCYAIGCLPALVYLAVQRDDYPMINSRVKLHWLQNFSFGRWLLVMSIAWLLGDAALRWLVGLFHGRAELGRFAAAFTVVMFVNPLVLTIQNLSRSYAARALVARGPQRLQAWTLRQSLWLGLAGGIVLGVIAVAGDPLVSLLYGGEFAGLGSVVAVLCAGYFLNLLTVPTEAALSALQEGKSIFLAGSIRLFSILVFGIPLIWRYYSFGVGMTLAISSFATVAVQWYLLERRCCRAS